MNNLSDEEFLNELIKRSENFADQECRKYAVKELEKLKSDISCKFLNSYKYSAPTIACVLLEIDNYIRELKGE